MIYAHGAFFNNSKQFLKNQKKQYHTQYNLHQFRYYNYLYN